MNLEKEKLELAEMSEAMFRDGNTNRDIKMIAEGDSWFDYPLQKDIIDHLRKLGFAISRRNNMAKFGDTLENMVYGSEIDIDEKRRTVTNFGPRSLDATVASVHANKPRFVLFSAGGNDIVGDEIIFYLNHKLSGKDPFRRELFENHVNGVMRPAIQTFIDRIVGADQEVHILMDGYDYPIPTGDMVNIAGLIKSGPWILPSMGKKGITDRNEQVQIIRQLVDYFNAMLADLDRTNSNFHYVRLLGMFPNEKDWHNEIHLYKEGYARVAGRYAEKVQEVLGYNPLDN
jgi:hypothetical protein